MKRIIAAFMVLLIFAGAVTASAGTAGGSNDPLVSRSYIDGEFTSALLSEGAENSGKTLSEAYDKALLRLDAIYKEHVGYSYAARYTELGLQEGKKVTLTMGSSFIMLSGTASLNIIKGSVINVSTGLETSSGSLITPNRRYFCAEDTEAEITAADEVLGLVDGYFITDGRINPNATMFKDVRRTDWYFPAVDFVYAEGLFAGTAADMFSPAAPMTRAMFVTVLYRLAGAPDTVLISRFSDVTDSGEYYYEPVAWASESGVVAGYEDGTFMPNRAITREQMALIMYRYAEYTGIVLSDEGDAYDGFPDRGDVAPYAVTALRWATANAIINGSDGRLLPAETASRAQVAQIIFNFCRQMGEAADS